MRKVDIRVQRTYQQLVDAVMKLLTEKDFESLSVSDICEAASVHRATFYKHFSDKFEFINYCFKSKITSIDLQLLINDPTPLNVKNAILRFIKEIFEFADKNIPLLSIICSEKYYVSLGTILSSTLNDYCMKYFSSVLTAPTHKLEIMANFYTNALTGVVRWYVLNNDKSISKDVFDFLEHRTDELIAYYEKNLYDGSRA